MAAKPRMTGGRTAPKHLQPLTRAWWSDAVQSYGLEEHRVRLLTLAAEAWDRCEAAREVLDREGVTYSDRFQQPKTRPEVAVERDSRNAFRELVKALSLPLLEPEPAGDDIHDDYGI